jgi:hypothetical protein
MLEYKVNEKQKETLQNRCKIVAKSFQTKKKNARGYKRLKALDINNLNNLNNLNNQKKGVKNDNAKKSLQVKLTQEIIFIQEV